MTYKRLENYKSRCRRGYPLSPVLINTDVNAMMVHCNQIYTGCGREMGNC